MQAKNRKKIILEAAEEVFSEKGLAEATISEIARRAGIADSLIYQHFKGKEDLLFSIPGERMKEVLVSLDGHLQGIRDSESRLSKMIWFHLKNHDDHPNYARILLLECRSSKEFYSTAAYQLVRKYAGVLLGILEQGIQDGTFRPDLETRLVREIILGTLDWETISSLAFSEIDESAADLEGIMSLVHAILTLKGQGKVSKSDRILTSAEKIFAEKGFTRTKVADISKHANVAEGTVYEYFSSKEDLLLAIPEKRFESYLDDLTDTYNRISPLRKLKSFIRFHFSLFLKERDFLRVFLLQIQFNRRFYLSEAFVRFQGYYKVLEEIVEQGKADGSFRPDVNARVFRNMFLGTFSHLALRWLILNKGVEFDKLQEILQVTELLTSAVTVENHI